MSQFEIIDTLRSETENADAASANALARNSLVRVKEFLSTFDANEACQLAGDHVTVSCQRLAVHLIASTDPNDAEKSVIEDLRTAAIEAIDRMQVVCEHYGPSGPV